MNVEEKGYALMAAALPDLVNKIKPPGNWQSLALPYIVHFIVGEEPGYTYTEGLEAHRARGYQVSVFGSDYEEASTIVDTVISALSGNHDGVTFFYRDRTYVAEQRAQEEGIAPCHIALDFDGWSVD